MKQLKYRGSIVAPVKDDQSYVILPGLLEKFAFAGDIRS
jgi:hypothetical protein